MWLDIYIFYVALPSYQLTLLLQRTRLILYKLLPLLCAYIYKYLRHLLFTANILSYYLFYSMATPSFFRYAIWQNIQRPEGFNPILWFNSI